MKHKIRILWLILLFAAVNLGMNSCVLVRRPTSKPRTTVVLKRTPAPTTDRTIIIFRKKPHPPHPRHPHGGPPGQTKKKRGHPGKRL